MSIRYQTLRHLELTPAIYEVLGQTHKNAVGAEKFARLIGLRKTPLLNLRTLGTVYCFSRTDTIEPSISKGK